MFVYTEEQHGHAVSLLDSDLTDREISRRTGINRTTVKLPSGRLGRYAYPRYFFTNYSADIRRIFCDHCDLLSIRWSQSNPRNISISHRDSVALLDSFVGPKS
jgi:hypothetical protein